jgi:hydrogenase maturation protease
MVEAVYLMDQVPDIHLMTISIAEMKPMTLELSEAVKAAIPKAIDKIIQLTQALHS